MPCARLSWPFRQLWSARKYIVSYRIVAYTNTSKRLLYIDHWMKVSKTSLTRHGRVETNETITDPRSHRMPDYTSRSGASNPHAITWTKHVRLCVYLSVSTRVITVFPESSSLLGLLLSVWTIFVVSECKKRWKNLRNRYTRLRKEDYSCQVEGVAKSSMSTSVDERRRALTRVYGRRRARRASRDGRRRARCEWALKLERDWRGVGLDVAELLRTTGSERSQFAEFSHAQRQMDVGLLHEPVESGSSTDLGHRQSKDVASGEVWQPKRRQRSGTIDNS